MPVLPLTPVLLFGISYRAALSLDADLECVVADSASCGLLAAVAGEAPDLHGKESLEMLQMRAAATSKNQGAGSPQIAAILADMKANLETRNGMAGKALVVLGNPGGDMDSVAGAIALATFLQSANVPKFLAHNESTTVHDSKCGSAYTGFSNLASHYDGIIPVINFERKYFHLRKDIQYVLLNVLNISERSLVFIDEIQVNDDTSFFLVDHNAINAVGFQDAAGKNRAGQVDFVVDHHADQSGGQPQGNVDCYIELVGSCSSLIATLIKESTQMKSGTNFLEENPQWATLLLAVEHQDWDPDKSLQYDKDIMVQLSQWSLGSKNLLDLKRSVSNFTVEDFFLKDAKGGNVSGISFTMPELPIHNMTSFMTGSDSSLLWTSQDFELQVERFLQEFKYDVVFLLKCPDQSPPPGELAVLTHNAALVEYMANISHLQPKGGNWYSGQNPQLQEATSPFTALGHLSQRYWTYKQGTRKQMLPMVNDLLSAFA